MALAERGESLTTVNNGRSWVCRWTVKRAMPRLLPDGVIPPLALGDVTAVQGQQGVQFRAGEVHGAAAPSAVREPDDL